MLIRTIHLYFTAVLFVVQANAQTKSELISQIRKNFRAINNDRSLTQIKLTDEDFMDNVTDGGGELTGYYKKDSIVKITEWIGLSYGNRTREFYFMSNKLFFVYEKFDSFIVNDSTGEMDHSKTKTSFEGRYYFSKDKLIEKKLAGKRTFQEESNEIVRELVESAKEDARLLSQGSQKKQ